jgi:hypothetical protein
VQTDNGLRGEQKEEEESKSRSSLFGTNACMTLLLISKNSMAAKNCHGDSSAHFGGATTIEFSFIRAEEQQNRRPFDNTNLTPLLAYATYKAER